MWDEIYGENMNNPGNALSLNNIALIYYEKGDMDEAI